MSFGMGFERFGFGRRLPLSLAAAALLATLGVGAAFSLYDAEPHPPAAPAAFSPRSDREAAFLARIRRSDPDRQTILMARFNRQGELGVILGRRVPLDSVSALMRAMLARMAREFPGRDLTIVAYAPATPPLKVGTAHLNARTRGMSYTPARPVRTR